MNKHTSKPIASTREMFQAVLEAVTTAERNGYHTIRDGDAIGMKARHVWMVTCQQLGLPYLELRETKEGASLMFETTYMPPAASAQIREQVNQISQSANIPVFFRKVGAGGIGPMPVKDACELAKQLQALVIPELVSSTPAA